MDTLSGIFSKWSWVDFCGRKTFVTWNMQYRDLDICFQYLVFQVPVLVILMIMSAYYNGALRLAVRRSRRDLHILTARWTVTLLLTIVPAVQLYIEEFLYPGYLHSVDYLLAVVQCFSWLIHFFYVMALRHWLAPSLRGPYPMGVVWTAYFILSCMIFRSNFIIARDPDSILYASNLPLVFSGVQVALQVAYLITLIPSGSNIPPLRFFSLNSGDDSRERTPLLTRYSGLVETVDQSFLGQPMESASSLSRLFFSWVNPLMSKGSAGKLEDADDLFELPIQLTSFYLNAKISSTVAPDYIRGRRGTPPRRSLFRALHLCYWLQFYGVGILKLCSDMLGFAGPLLLNQLIKFMEDGTRPLVHGFMIVFGLFLATLLGAFFNSHFNFWMSMVGFKIRGALVTLIYKKLVNLNKVSMSKMSTGEIVNFMSADMDRITNSCPSFHSLWSIPFQIAFTLYLLYQQVGLSFLAGVAFSIILIPINKKIADQIGKLSTKMMAAKDRRVGFMSEILRGIKAVKLYVFEDVFIDKVTEARKEELKYLAGRKYLDAICVYFWATTPVIITILTFVTYSWFLGHKLTAAVVFTTIALLNMLIAPLNAFPWVLNGLTEAWVSLNRLEKLMELPDLDLSGYYEDAYREENDFELQIIDGYFTWGENKFGLSSIDLNVKKGQLIGIIGPVGGGKSSLLAAITAEMFKTSGRLISDYEQGYGYVSQTPWLQKCSIKDNILFGEPFVERKYGCIVKACALESDFEDLPRRDSTVVGDSGGTLSGGQRARIALARAVYQDFPVYLLDDILSAVDPHVARQIYDMCICGVLQNKTRLLVTHQSRYLLSADHVIVLNEGRIVRQGPPSQVLPNYVDLVAEQELEKVTVKQEPKEMPKRKISYIVEKQAPDENEEKATGSLAVKVYTRYFRAVGPVLCVLIVASIVLMQGSKNIVDLWLTYWITNENPPNSTSTDNVTRTDSFYLEVYAGLAGLNTAFTLFRAFLFAFGGLSAAAIIHKSLLTRVIKAKMLFFQTCPVGQILNRFSADVCTIDDSLPFILNILLALLFQVIGTLVMVVYGLPWMCVLLATLAPVYVSLQNHYSTTSRDLKRISSITLSPLYSHFSETIQGLEVIKSFRATSRFQHNNAIWLEANQKAQFCCSAVAQWLGIRLQLIGVVTVSVVGILAISFNHQNPETSALLGLAITYALTLTGSLGSLVNAFTETERELISVERVGQYLDGGSDLMACPELDTPVSDLILPFGWPSQGVISFVNVYFKYGNHLPYSLVNVSFTTRPAERIGVVGRTGAGKSSLISALFRLAEISRGAISVDFVNISVVSLNTLRSRMGIIPQEPFIFDGTVRTNLDPKGNHNEYELWRALKETHLVQIVQNMGGLDAPLSGSTGLSVGQKQLLCLARAILQNAKIICIDEATANVDEETDRLIQKTLRDCFRQRTVLTIAHRVQTIIDSDRILVMGDGRVVEFDTPSNLLENEQSVFYKMVNER